MHCDAHEPAGRPRRPSLRLGLRLDQTSRFADDTWRLEPAILQQHVHSKALNFATVLTFVKPTPNRAHGDSSCGAAMLGDDDP
jgi:hypothetical protein